MMNSRWNSLLAAALLTAAAGCGSSSHSAVRPSGGEATEPGDVDEATPPSPVAQAGAGEDEDDSTADLAEHHRHHHHGGVAMFIAMSLPSLNATPEQVPAIARIRADMLGAIAPAHDAEKAALLALADGIATNEIDQPAIDTAIAQLTASAASTHDAIVASLAALHATLTPPQRIALVDKVEAHFEVWHHANAPDEAATRDAHGGHLARLATELALSPQQVEAVRENFASSMSRVPRFDRAEADAHIKAFSAAFSSDRFDPSALAMDGAVTTHMASWGILRTVRFYEAVLPVLTPEQRAKLADRVRHHANYQHNAMPADGSRTP